METYIWTHTPDPATLQRDLRAAHTAVVAVRIDFTTICETTAAEFRDAAQGCYQVGDQRRGDHFTALALGWELARETGNLTDMRPC